MSVSFQLRLRTTSGTRPAVRFAKSLTAPAPKTPEPDAPVAPKKSVWKRLGIFAGLLATAGVGYGVYNASVSPTQTVTASPYQKMSLEGTVEYREQEDRFFIKDHKDNSLLVLTGITQSEGETEYLQDFLRELGAGTRVKLNGIRKVDDLPQADWFIVIDVRAQVSEGGK